MPQKKAFQAQTIQAGPPETDNHQFLPRLVACSQRRIFVLLCLSGLMAWGKGSYGTTDPTLWRWSVSPCPALVLSIPASLFSPGSASPVWAGALDCTATQNKRQCDKSIYTIDPMFVFFLACLLKCSGHGRCDPITKRCICYQLWMENLIHRYLNDGESNCGELGCCGMYLKNNLSSVRVLIIYCQNRDYFWGRCWGKAKRVCLFSSPAISVFISAKEWQLRW